MIDLGNRRWGSIPHCHDASDKSAAHPDKEPGQRTCSLCRTRVGAASTAALFYALILGIKLFRRAWRLLLSLVLWRDAGGTS